MPGRPPIDGESAIDTRVRVRANQNAQNLAFVMVIALCNSLAGTIPAFNDEECARATARGM
jgi:hypothetical protein